ncbi:hypothetical protein G3I60_05045 [Streptomyces sp. SID13666]|uniref:hypothetical protein n=1 Tax=Streptomyces sp. SID13666 TaxID=2706054 RepID=UPI0013C231C1|nr:hypothetical protein [Streptomyces sp. SID13666]NEA53536.1 hypothetical protein [Streptomyces sp. SID13666]
MASPDPSRTIAFVASILLIMVGAMIAIITVFANSTEDPDPQPTTPPATTEPSTTTTEPPWPGTGGTTGSPTPPNPTWPGNPTPTPTSTRPGNSGGGSTGGQDNLTIEGDDGSSFLTAQ